MIGQTVSHYKIIEKLGGGGMGVVYKAEDTLLKRTVALKFLPPEFTFDPEAKQRFLHEAQAASALQQANLCTIHDIGETPDGQMFICMDFYEGDTLKDALKQGPLSADRAVEVAMQICRGLSRAHEAGIIHRDIKPANIMLTSRGEVKILDFGLAKLAGQTRLTKTGTTLGTAAYMSPEQARSETVDRRSDIWSVGVVLYEMLSGRLPFPTENDQVLLYAILNQKPQPLGDVETGISESIDQIVQKSLAKKPEERYQTADELMADLKVIKGGKETSGVTLAGQLARKSARRKTLLRVGLGVAAVAICAVAYVFVSPMLQESALASNPKTILIIPFENQTGDNGLDNLRISIQDQLITSLEQSKYFSVVTRQRITDLLKQMGKQPTDRVDHSLGLELCRREGAEVIVEGSFTRAGTVYATTARLLNVSTLQSMNTFTANGKGVESYLLTQIDNLSKDISNGFGVRRKTTEETLRPIAEVTTSSAEAYQLYLSGLDKSESFDDVHARAPLELAVKKDSNFVLAWIRLIDVYTSIGDQRAAETCARKAVSLARRATERERFMIAGFDSLVRTEVMGGRLVDIIDFVKYRAERFPKEKEFQAMLGFMLRNQDRPIEAIAVFKKALDLDPSYRPVLNTLGYTYEYVGQFQNSIETFERIAAAYPGDANCFDSMGDIYRGHGLDSEAIDSYKHALAVRPDFVSSAMGIAGISFNSEDYTEALRWIDSAIAIAPVPAVQAMHMNVKAYYLLWLGKLTSAEKELRASRRLLLKAGFMDEDRKAEGRVDPIEPWILCDRGKLNKARDLVRAWWNKEPKDDFDDSAMTAGRKIELNFLLGLMDLRGGQTDSAETRLTEITRLGSPYATGDSTPGTPGIVKRVYIEYRGLLRGELYLRDGRPVEAMEVISVFHSKRFLASRPVWLNRLRFMNWVDLRWVPLPQDLYPRACVALGSLDSAIAAYKRAVSHEADPGRPIIPRYHYRLALLYEKQGMKEEAISEYEKFLKIWGKADPVYKEPADARSRLARLRRG